MATEQQFLASWIAWVQMTFASLIDSIVSELFSWRAMLNSEINFCWQASMKDLIASRSLRALLASSQRWVTSGGGVSLLGSGVSAVGEGVGISSREASSISALSGHSPGMMCPLAWENLPLWCAKVWPGPPAPTSLGWSSLIHAQMCIIPPGIGALSPPWSCWPLLPHFAEEAWQGLQLR